MWNFVVCAPMFPRTAHLDRLRSLLRQSPVVALLGARQVGKTTLARQLAPLG
jgi:predicted AAA+ superfamily ATPase